MFHRLCVYLALKFPNIPCISWRLYDYGTYHAFHPTFYSEYIKPIEDKSNENWQMLVDFFKDTYNIDIRLPENKL